MTTVEGDWSEIPDELQERDQWLLWDASADTPRRPHWDGDFHISWSDPADWRSFEEAVELARSVESWGIGYVMAADNDDHARGIYGCLDLDGALREPLEPKPKEWLPSLEPFIEDDAYIEFSAGDDGLHIPIVGHDRPEWFPEELHFTDDEHEGVEFLTNKFVTFTGNKLGGSGGSVTDADPTQFLFESYQAIEGESPTLSPSADAQQSSGYDGDEWLTEEDVRDALDRIDPDVGYATWRDIGFAIHDFDSGSTGRRLFEEWSKTGSKWDSEAKRYVKAIWESASPGDGVTVGTLIHHAREGGWELPDRSPTPDAGGETEDADPPEDPSETETWDTVRSYYENDETPTRHARQAAVWKLLNDHHFATPVDTERIWKYDPSTGIYEPEGEAFIQERLADGLKAYYSQHERNEIIGKVRARTYIDRDEFDGEDDQHLLCCANGVLDLETRELTEHSPEHLFTRAVPVEYDPDGEAPAVESFLEDITRRDADKQTLLEMVGAALWPGYEHSKFLILFGEGANGKSTYFETVEALLGSENVSGWELQKFSENRFATSDLVGKFANIAPDMPGTKLTELGTLKTLTGGDTTMGEDKGQPAFEFVNKATLMFGANRPPVIPEASRAIERRIVPIRLPYNFTPEDDGNPDARDRQELLADLTTDEELSGLLNLALDGLDRLRDQGDVSLPETHEERLEYYEQFSDPIKEFRINCLENSRGTRVRKSAVYDAYKQFCREHGYAVKDNRIFWRTLRKTTLTYDESRPQIDGERVRVLNDTKFTEVGLEHAPPSIVDAASDEEDSLGATSLSAATPGYADLTVEVRASESQDAGAPMAWSGVFRDETATVDAIDWSGSDVAASLEVGECYLLEDAKMGYGPNGEDQVELVEGVTTAEPIQYGVGYAPTKDSETQEQLPGAAADGGRRTGLRGRLLEVLSDQSEPQSVGTLAGQLDEDPETVAERLDSLATRGEVEERDDGYAIP